MFYPTSITNIFKLRPKTEGKLHILELWSGLQKINRKLRNLLHQMNGLLITGKKMHVIVSYQDH
jgi:hypothetical protein